jgi:hypothetical protein
MEIPVYRLLIIAGAESCPGLCFWIRAAQEIPRHLTFL